MSDERQRQLIAQWRARAKVNDRTRVEHPEWADDLKAMADVWAVARRECADDLEALLTERPQPREAPMMIDDDEPLHTGDDERMDLLCGVLTFLQELEGEDAPIGDQLADDIGSAIDSCEKLHVLLEQTVRRERGPEPLGSPTP